MATLLNDGFGHHGKRAMALSEFEIAIGGLTSIPVVGGLIFLGYKSFGESSIDTSKLKPKKKPADVKATPTPDKKPEAKSQKTEKNINTTTTNKEKSSAVEQPNSAKEETSISSKKQPEEK